MPQIIIYETPPSPHPFWPQQINRQIKQILLPKREKRQAVNLIITFFPADLVPNQVKIDLRS